MRNLAIFIFPPPLSLSYKVRIHNDMLGTEHRQKRSDESLARWPPILPGISHIDSPRSTSCLRSPSAGSLLPRDPQVNLLSVAQRKVLGLPWPTLCCLLWQVGGIVASCPAAPQGSLFSLPGRTSPGHRPRVGDSHFCAMARQIETCDLSLRVAGCQDE